MKEIRLTRGYVALEKHLRKQKSTKPLDVVGRLGFGPGNMIVDLRKTGER